MILDYLKEVIIVMGLCLGGPRMISVTFEVLCDIDIDFCPVTLD